MAASPSFKLLMFVSVLCQALSDQDLNLNEHPQDGNLDPTLQGDSKQFHRLSPTDKRTIFSNLLNHNNFALARHFVYRNGVKYLLGYGQVDLRYTPHFKSVYIRPRLPLPWTYTGISHKTVSVIHQQLPKPILPIVSHHNVWQDTPVTTSKPDSIHISAATPQEGAYPISPIGLVHMQPVKINLPVLPFGAMFLTSVLPKHQQHLEYYPLPMPQPVAGQHVHVHNPYPHHVQELPPPTVALIPGSSYKVHGYQPHQHISFVPSTVAIAQETPAHQEEAPPELQQYHTIEDQTPPQDQPYVGSLEFHGKHFYQNHAIQPGHTDVQIPLHLTQHPTYHPEDYYNYLQDYHAAQRNDVAKRNVSKAPFKPSERIYSYKEV